MAVTPACPSPRAAVSILCPQTRQLRWGLSPGHQSRAHETTLGCPQAAVAPARAGQACSPRAGPPPSLTQVISMLIGTMVSRKHQRPRQPRVPGLAHGNASAALLPPAQRNPGHQPPAAAPERCAQLEPAHPAEFRSTGSGCKKGIVKLHSPTNSAWTLASRYAENHPPSMRAVSSTAAEPVPSRPPRQGRQDELLGTGWEPRAESCRGAGTNRSPGPRERPHRV